MATVMQYPAWPFLPASCTPVSQLNPNHQPDACIRIRLTDEDTSKPREEILFAHKHILAKSAVLRQQLAYLGAAGAAPFAFSTCFLDLTMVPHAMTNFKKLLMLMYGGGGGSGDEMLPPESTVASLAKYLQFPEMPPPVTTSKPAISESLAASQLAMLASMASVPTSSEGGNPLANLYATCLLQNAGAPAFMAATIAAMNSMGANNGTSTTTETSLSPGIVTLPSSTPPSVADRSPTAAPSSPEATEQLIVSNEKEGWCRNKKYIETVPNGYRCTVCRKVYGRYNSVSYHVTIYHRNPPIQCGVEGCPFTTREARYIHFHKYYRHGIKLPDSIDLASRKCPYCRHISKSPAMLEKHICRHVQDCMKNGQDYTCFKCNFETTDQKAMFAHLREHSLPSASEVASESAEIEAQPAVLRCQMCPLVAEDRDALQRHQILTHSGDLMALASQATTAPMPQTSTVMDEAMARQQLTLMAWQQLLLNQSAAAAAMTAPSTTAASSPSPTASEATSISSSL